MGMTIEQAQAMLKSYLHGSTGYTGSLRDAIDTVLPIVEKYQLMQADYETRFRADMVAILTDIQMEIDEQWEITWKSDYKGGYKDGCVKANDIIQQKINVLRAGTEGK